MFKYNTKDILIQINTKIGMCVCGIKNNYPRNCDIYFLPYNFEKIYRDYIFTEQFWKEWILFSEQFGCICVFVCTSTYCMVNRQKKINCVVVNDDSSPKKVVSIKGQIFDHSQNGLKLLAAKHCTRLSRRRVNLVESPTYRGYW